MKKGRDIRLRSDTVIKTICFGPVDIDLKDLIVMETDLKWRTKMPKRLNLLLEDIKKNGLINPLEIICDWERGELGVHKGNSRLWCLEKLGFQKAPCYMKIYVTKEIEKQVELLKKILPTATEQDGEELGFPPLKPANGYYDGSIDRL